MSQSEKPKENAVLRITSTQSADGETERTELDTKAKFEYSAEQTEITYYEVDELGREICETVITILRDDLVTIRKTGFISTSMVLERGKSHPVQYISPFGTLEMLLCAQSISGDFTETGGTLRMQYLIDIGDSYSARNTIELRVSRREQPGQ